jgi:hypothetical protein
MNQESFVHDYEGLPDEDEFYKRLYFTSPPNWLDKLIMSGWLAIPLFIVFFTMFLITNNASWLADE